MLINYNLEHIASFAKLAKLLLSFTDRHFLILIAVIPVPILLLLHAVAFQTVAAESYGAASIKPFCEGRGRLDDLKDLASDIYVRQTGRAGPVRNRFLTFRIHYLRIAIIIRNINSYCIYNCRIMQHSLSFPAYSLT